MLVEVMVEFMYDVDCCSSCQGSLKVRASLRASRSRRCNNTLRRYGLLSDAELAKVRLVDYASLSMIHTSELDP